MTAGSGDGVNCALCGKPVERVRPCLYSRLRGEVTCDECCEKCYSSEPFPCRDHDDREREWAKTEPITYYAADGSVTFRGTYDAAVEKLFELEEQRQPEERYTFRGRRSGAIIPSRGIQLVLSRLYDNEHGR